MTKPSKVWSETSQSAWRKLGFLATHWAHSEDSDQTGRMPGLIWVFAGCTVIFLVLSWGGSFLEFSSTPRCKFRYLYDNQHIVLVSDSITLDYVPIHRRRRSHSTEQPEEIHTKFTSNDENIDLKLWRTKWQQDKSPVRYFRLGMQYENKVDKETEGVG